ncbi:LysM peptidoglycan-binding domain-containing protein [Salinibacterium sp.]|uniref:LysM peptidoglycan-binding domain-containing protein n=1 Tax=Salinibacterium sp. TaxID=1915057 RepID=UPI00286C1AC7|nr:LysM peptidoglycan-binding domain-containing protein [Salinibacterium sp.]
MSTPIATNAAWARAESVRGVRVGAPRLRMTKRGRSVLSALIAAPLVVGAMLIALNGGEASASRDSSDVAFQYVTVASGESLWQLASELAPTADPRDVIDQIIQLNELASSDVFAGQELAIPVQYSQD